MKYTETQFAFLSYLMYAIASSTMCFALLITLQLSPFNVDSMNLKQQVFVSVVAGILLFPGILALFILPAAWCIIFYVYLGTF